MPLVFLSEKYFSSVFLSTEKNERRKWLVAVHEASVYVNKTTSAR